jgi:hypothetical protein
MNKGDKVIFNPKHPHVEALKRDFGEGPFTIRAVEDDFCSLIRCSDGRAWIAHRGRWESPGAPVGLHKAIPPTFHQDWLAPAD